MQEAQQRKKSLKKIRNQEENQSRKLKSRLSLDVFEECILTATIYPSNAADKSIEWTTSDETVAKVSQTGTVTPVSKRTAVIKAAAKDGSGEYDGCDVTVVLDGQLFAKYSELESEHNYANKYEQGLEIQIQRCKDYGYYV